MANNFSISLPENTHKFVGRRVAKSGIFRSKYFQALAELDRTHDLLPRALRRLSKTRP